MTTCCSTLFWKTCVGFSLAAFAITGCAPRGGTPPKEAVVEIEEIEMQPAEPTVKEPAADSGAEARKAVDEEKAAADKAIVDAGRSIQEPKPAEPAAEPPAAEPPAAEPPAAEPPMKEEPATEEITPSPEPAAEEKPAAEPAQEKPAAEPDAEPDAIDDTKPAIELRRQFSFDPRVSVESTMSYAGSHDPSMGCFANTKTAVGPHKHEADLVEFMRACTGPTPTAETRRLPADS